MAERGGIHQILEISSVYVACQNLVYRTGSSDALLGLLYPELGSRPLRVLDIGCGPAAFYARYQSLQAFTYVTYVGIEPNSAYVEDARRRFPEIELHAGTVPEVRDAIRGEFDLVVLEGVLHHIDDATAQEALAFAAERLAPGGRLVAIDPVLLEQQHPVARTLARLDRGKHVRTLDSYQALAVTAFPESDVSVEVLSGQLRVPYGHSVLRAARPWRAR